MTRILTVFMVAVIRAYQFAMRPLLVGGCRFVPHCSEYALEAVSRHGPWRGAWLTVKRLARCHPFSGRRGFDPVP